MLRWVGVRGLSRSGTHSAGRKKQEGNLRYRAKD